MKPLNVLYTCAAMGASGYSEASRNYIAALASQPDVNLSVKSVNFEPWKTDQSAYADIINPLLNKPMVPDVNVIHMTPENFPQHRKPGIKNIGYTVWETSLLPKKWPSLCNLLDGVMVPCDWNVDVFRNSGVTVPVRKVEHAIDITEFEGKIPHMEFGFPKDKYIFYSVFQWTERKNPVGLIRAFLSEFTKQDNVCLVLKSYRLNNSEEDKKWVEKEIHSVGSTMYLEDHAPIYLVHKALSRHAMLSLHEQGDCFVAPSRAEGWSVCLTPDSLVNTATGPVEIGKIRAGDEVFSHTGAIQKVTGTTRNKYSGEMISLSRFGFPGRPLIGTPYHPHLIVKRKHYKHHAIREMINNKTIKPEWIPLSQVEKGDFICIPKPKLDYKNIEKIDFAKYLDPGCFSVGEDVIFSKMSHKTNADVSYATVAKKAKCSMQYAGEVISGNLKNSKLQLEIQRIASECGYIKPERVITNRFLDFSDDAAEFLGLYIAEGWAMPSNVSVCSHEKEDDARTIEKKLFSQITNASTVERFHKFRKAAVIECYSDVLAKIFQKMFGMGARRKRIPQELISSNWAPGILRGIFYGDGSVSSGAYSFSTSSHGLYQDINHALMCHGILCNMTYSRGNYVITVAKKFNEIFEALVKPRKYGNKCKLGGATRNDSIIVGDGMWFVPIRNVDVVKYDGDVCNLHVEGDQSYTVDFMATHNCHFESMAFGNQTIGPNFGGNLEFMTEQNSYLIDCFQTPVANMPWPIYNGRATWAEPRIDHLKQLMRQAYNERESNTKGMKAKEDIQQFSWKIVGEKMVNAIKEML